MRKPDDFDQFCSAECAEKFVEARKSFVKLHRSKRRNAQTGASSELIVAAYLLDRGWDVFRNVAATGPIDLIAWRNGVALFIQVKTDASTWHGCADVITHLAHYNRKTRTVVIKSRGSPMDDIS